MSSQEPHPCEEFFFISYVRLFFFSAVVAFSSSCAFRASSRYLLSILRPLRRLLGLRPLAKRRTYWLS